MHKTEKNNFYLIHYLTENNFSNITPVLNYQDAIIIMAGLDMSPHITAWKILCQDTSEDVVSDFREMCKVLISTHVDIFEFYYYFSYKIDNSKDINRKIWKPFISDIFPLMQADIYHKGLISFITRNKVSQVIKYGGDIGQDDLEYQRQRLINSYKQDILYIRSGFKTKQVK